MTTIRGKTLSISFIDEHDYSAGQYFYIDKYIVTHTLGLENSLVDGDTIRILPRRLAYINDSLAGKHYETIENINMALNLYDALEGENQGLPFNDRYTCISPSLLSLTGEFRISRNSGKPIKVRVPKDYPLSIKKINR